MMREQKENKFSNEDALLQGLNLIFYAMVGVPLIVFLYLYLEIKDGNFAAATPDPDIHRILIIIIPVFSFINIAIAYFLYNKHLKKAAPTDALRTKLEVFYNASLFKYSFLEAASILPVIALFLTGEMVYTAIYLVALLFFSLNRPTPMRLRSDMKIKTYPPSRQNEGTRKL